MSLREAKNEKTVVPFAVIMAALCMVLCITVLNKNNGDLSQTDETEIRTLIGSFFDSKEAAFTDEGCFELPEYFDESLRDGLEKQAIYKLIQYEKLARDYTIDDVSDESFSYSINSIIVLGDLADAEAYEEYCYRYAGNESESSRGEEYRFELKKGEDGWKMISVSTSNELEIFVEDIDDIEAFFMQDESD